MKRPASFCVIGFALILFGALGVATARDRVVVIGFDGADARLVERWMDEGQLPNLARLREEGTYASLEPTNPPQTPVSWSSFATGLQPGKTEIFDFLMRDPANYLPDFAMVSESRRTFLFGERNGLIVGLGGGVAIFLLITLAMLLTRLGWRSRLVLGLLLGAAAGTGAGWAAQRYLPVEIPDAINNRKGQTMWQIADAAGLDVQVIRVPATFPADEMEDGRMLSGLGVPDMRGRVGTPALYTSDPAFQADANEFSLELLHLPRRRGEIKTRVVGPYNKPFYDYVVDRRAAAEPGDDLAGAKRRIRRQLDDAGVPRRLDLPLELRVADDHMTWEVAGQAGTLRVGEWSDWLELVFPVNPLIDRTSPLKGIARLKLLALEPELQLYLSPINFHPDCHPVAFSWPPDYSEELLDRFGLYKTLGWALDTWSLPSGVGDEELFLQDMEFTVAKYAELMRGLLSEREHDLYVQIFYFTDRIGHLFWRFLDPGHPLYDAEEAERWKGEVLKAYRRMDELVGQARAAAGEDAVFIVCSDHGFSSFRRGVNYNNWLKDNGFMTLKDQNQEKANLEALFDTRELLQGVDWSKTQAYAIGLGSIYINLAGREAKGIVLPGPEYEEVMRKIKEGLESLVDPETGKHPITRVYTRRELYGEGYDDDLIPDLRASTDLDYRVSWQTSLGGFGETILEDNTKAWSGDHCSNDPKVVPGIFFSSKPINTDQPRMIDIMPSILSTLDLAIPDGVDGRSLYSD